MLDVCAGTIYRGSVVGSCLMFGKPRGILRASSAEYVRVGEGRQWSWMIFGRARNGSVLICD